MDYIEQIKRGIKELYKNDPDIHISVSKTRSKTAVASTPVRIVGVYNNIFRIEKCENGKMPARYSFQYGDVLIGHVVIEELNFTRPINCLNKKSK